MFMFSHNIHLTWISQNDIVLDWGVVSKNYFSATIQKKIQTPLCLEMLQNGWKQHERLKNNCNQKDEETVNTKSGGRKALRHLKTIFLCTFITSQRTPPMILQAVESY